MSDTTKGVNDASGDRRLEALESFGQWSNWLLVTTVAAVGWVAKADSRDSLTAAFAVWSLGISTLFGICTLALVPLVAEQMDAVSDRSSIFVVPVRFHAGGPALRTMYLTQACRPQHLSFILGVLLHCAAVTGYEGPKFSTLGACGHAAVPVTLLVTFAVVAVRSHRRPPAGNTQVSRTDA
jgi:hypothetical protein